MSAEHDARMQDVLNRAVIDVNGVCKSMTQGKEHASVIIVLDGERLHWASSLSRENVLVAAECLVAQLKRAMPADKKILLQSARGTH
jgi:predicted transcriptional regulator